MVQRKGLGWRVEKMMAPWADWEYVEYHIIIINLKTLPRLDVGLVGERLRGADGTLHHNIAQI